jgi:uncharacterized protein YkwD
VILHRKLWPLLGVFLSLTLAACDSGTTTWQAGQPYQATPGSQATPARIPRTPEPRVSISVQGHSSVPRPTQSAGASATRVTHSAAPTPSRTSGAGGSSQSQLAQYVLGLINHDRVAQGLSPYLWSPALAAGAHLHNQRMVAFGQLSHQCPGEAALGTRISSDGLAWTAAGENIGWADYPQPQQGVLSNHQAMMAEKPPDDGHRLNILSSTYTLVGIDVLIDSQHRTWLTEDFARV